MLGCSDNVFRSYPCRQSQRNKKCQKCLIICSNLVEKLSNLSEAQGTKRLPKFLTSNTCTCIYILNVRVCIQLHGYYILKPTLCLQYCMQKCIESLRLKDLRYWGLKKTCSWDFKFTLICFFKILKFSCTWCIDEQLVKIANIGASIEQQSRTCSCYDFSNSLAFNGFTYPWYWWHRNGLFSACWSMQGVVVCDNIYIYKSVHSSLSPT